MNDGRLRNIVTGSGPAEPAVDEGVNVPEKVDSEADGVEVVLEAVPVGVAAALAEVEPEMEVEGLEDEEEDKTLDAGQVRQLVSYC